MSSWYLELLSISSLHLGPLELAPRLDLGGPRLIQLTKRQIIGIYIDMNIDDAMAIMHPKLLVSSSPELEVTYQHIKSECDRLGLYFEHIGQEGSTGYFCYEFKIQNHKGIVAFNDEGLGVTSIAIDTDFLVTIDPTPDRITRALEQIVPIESEQDIADHMAELVGDDYGI